MISALLGTKLGETQAFDKDGRRIPVTYIQAGPCWVTKINNSGTYRSLQLGFGITKHMTKALAGHIEKAGLSKKPRFLREVPVDESGEIPALGAELTAETVFAVGDRVRVTGTSKGKGFAGVVKRHGFAGGPRTHGQSDRERAPGSVGSGTTPGRIIKGKKMAGRMGGARVTVKGLSVVSVDPVKHIVGIKGLVPGARQGLLIIQKEH